MEFLHPNNKDLTLVAQKFQQAYQTAAPFPHIAFTDFFNPELLEKVLAEFPDLSQNTAFRKHTQHSDKHASKGEMAFGATTTAFAHYLNSQPFLEFLQLLTSMERTLIPDPYFLGGGLHEIKAGGFLKIHADFNKHATLELDRRLNILVYLNKDWMEEYGGHLELWDSDMQHCVQKISPAFNTLAIFSTTSTSYHGHPDPLQCPPDRSRKSLALYYYTNGRPAKEVLDDNADHSTLYQERKGKEDQLTFKKVVKAMVPPILTKSGRKAMRK